MFKSEEININKLAVTEEGINVTVWKLTALWAFSEAALGGILHAFKIPFRGVFVGGSAAMLISLIAYYSEQRGTILKSTLLVMLIKAMVSPHTPVTAYFAVFLQGFLGEVLFFNKSFFRISALALGLLTLLLSSTQKIIIYTLVFGNTLWESIDQFASFVVNKFITQDNSLEFRFSYLLVGTYLSIHIILGIFIGIFSGKLPYRINDVMNSNNLDINSYNNMNSELTEKKKRKHKRWWQRPSGIILFSFAAVMVVVSYVYPELGSNKAYEIMIMVLRALIIMLLWYTIVGPLLLKYLRKYFKKKQILYSTEITKIVDTFPQLRTLVSHSWKVSSTERGYRKIKSFIIHLIAFLLLSDPIE